MTAEQFLQAIAGNLRRASEIMFTKYPDTGLTAEDFESEAIVAILQRLQRTEDEGAVVRRGARRTTIAAYDPDQVKPWTFASTIAMGAMVNAARRSIRGVEFLSPTQIKAESERLTADEPAATEGDSTAERFRSLCEQVGESLSHEDAASLSMYYGEGIQIKNLAPHVGVSPHALELRFDRIKKRLRAAAGSRGIAAFN